MTTFHPFGTIVEIRMNFQEVELKWEAFVTFDKNEDAIKVSSNINTLQINQSVIRGALTDKVPKNLDMYIYHLNGFKIPVRKHRVILHPELPNLPCG